MNAFAWIVINIIKDIIKYYENKIRDLEKEKIRQTLELNNKYKAYKDKLIERKEIMLKENKDKRKKN